MSRLDYFTIAIVAVCILAIVFLLYRATDLFKKDTDTPTPGTELYEEDPYSDEAETATDVKPSSSSENYSDYETENDTSSTIVYDLEDAGTDYEEPKAETATKTEKSTSTPRSSSSYTGSSSGSSYGDYLVLAGSFTVKAYAEAHQRKIEKLGYSNSEVTPFNGGKYASVLVARFDNEQDAADLVAELEGKGIDAYVHKKRPSSN
ncbi:MAG: SPOR domain-containing protein [Phaeodactylibacter sp.]|nr:SPOR domain-containing protein [Phaeodactylibacter sp.]